MVVDVRTEALHSRFDDDYDIVCAVDRDFLISYCNRAWNAAALRDECESLLSLRGVGTSIIDAISPCLRDFYYFHFLDVIDNQRPWHLFYLRSSATLLREFKMMVEPIADNGILIRHTLIAEKPHPFPALPPSHHYYDSKGHIAMCVHCRFTERQDGSDRWDWVPEFVETLPAHVDYGLCRLCARHFELK